MLLNLSQELLYKIFIISDNLYNLSLTNKIINKLKLQIYLLPYKFKNHYVCTTENLNRLQNFMNELYFYHYYPLSTYLKDLKQICNELNYYYWRHKKYRVFNKFIYSNTIRFNYYQINLYEEKKIVKTKIHPVYRVNYRAYEILKEKHLNILALIY